MENDDLIFINDMLDIVASNDILSVESARKLEKVIKKIEDLLIKRVD